MRSNQLRNNNYAPPALHPLSETDLPDLANCWRCKDKIRGRAFIAACLAKHRYCFHCVRRIYTLATTRNEKWPARCCKVPFVSTNLFIRVFLNKDEISLYKKKSMELSTSPANRVYCSRQGCAAFLGNRENHRGPIYCPYCNAATCWTCKHPAQRDHFFRENIKLEAHFLQVNPGWKRCMDCGTIIEIVTSTGCIHMACGYDHTYCYFSGKTNWTGLSKTCRCKRPDGRLHRQSPYSLPDPYTTFSPRVPEPRPSSRFDVILTEENRFIPTSTVQTSTTHPCCTYPPGVENPMDMSYPYRLPSTTAEGPADADSILRERKRWELSSGTYPEHPTEGACCLPPRLLISLEWKAKSLTAQPDPVSNTAPFLSPPPTPFAPTKNPSILRPEMRRLMQPVSLNRQTFGPIGTEIVPAPSPLSTFYNTPATNARAGPFGPMNTFRTSGPVAPFGPIGVLRRPNGPVSPFGPIGTPRYSYTSSPVSPFGPVGTPTRASGLASPSGPIGTLRTSGLVNTFGPVGTPLRASGQVTPSTSLAGTPRGPTDTPPALIDTPLTSIDSPLAPVCQVTSSLGALNIQNKNPDNYLTEDSTQSNSLFTEDVSRNNHKTDPPEDNHEYDWWGSSSASAPDPSEAVTYPSREPIDVAEWLKQLQERDRGFQLNTPRGERQQF